MARLLCIEAQRSQKDMRRCVDEAGELCGVLADWLVQFETLNQAESLEDKALFVLGSHMANPAQTEDWSALQAQIPSSVPVPAGTKEFIGMSVRFAQLLGEHEAMLEIAIGAMGVLVSNATKAREVLNNPRFRAAYIQAANEAYSAGEGFHIILAAARREQVLLDALMEQAHSLVESATRPQVGLIASCLSQRGYARVIKDGANEAIRLIIESGYSKLADGLPVELRNAKAHRSYKLSADNRLVEITKDNGTLLSAMDGEQLSDALIAAHMTHIGLTLGCYMASVALATDPEGLLGNLDLMPLEASIEVGAMFLGWKDLQVSASDVEGGGIRIENCPRLSASPLGGSEFHNLLAAVTIARLLPDSVRWLFCVDDHDSPVRIDATAMRTAIFNKQAEGIHLVGLLRGITRDGISVLSDSDWKRKVAEHAIMAIGEGAPSVIKKLRKIRSVVKDDGDAELAELLNVVISEESSRCIGLDENFPTAGRDRLMRMASGS